MNMLRLFLMVYIGGTVLATAGFAITAVTACILSRKDEDIEDEGYKDGEMQNTVFLATALVLCVAITWPLLVLGLVLDAIMTK